MCHHVLRAAGVVFDGRGSIFVDWIGVAGVYSSFWVRRTEEGECHYEDRLQRTPGGNALWYREENP